MGRRSRQVKEERARPETKRRNIRLVEELRRQEAKADSDEEEEGPGLVARVKTYFQTRSPSFYIRLCAWLGLYYYFIQVEFGLVYFIVSAILFMFLNTSATGSDPEAPSAYSVFNQDGTTLPGTFSTKSLENAIGLPKYGD